MTRKATLAIVSGNDELLELADEIDNIGRTAWGLVAAVEGIENSDPRVQGVAHLAGALAQRIGEIRDQIERLRKTTEAA